MKLLGNNQKLPTQDYHRYVLIFHLIINMFILATFPLKSGQTSFM